MSTQSHLFPLFKGMTRPSMIAGVPSMALLFAFLVSACFFMILGLAWLLLFPILWGVMWTLVRYDDRALENWWLYLQTRLNHRNVRFWGGTVYIPHNRRKKGWGMRP
jgi:type IV secretory pathway VirB3-like protein